MLSFLKLAIYSTAAVALTSPLVVQDNLQQVLSANDVKVPVKLGVMSRCPDAMLCESVFETVFESVGHKMDFSLTFIGT